MNHAQAFRMLSYLARAIVVLTVLMSVYQLSSRNMPMAVYWAVVAGVNLFAARVFRDWSRRF